MPQHSVGRPGTADYSIGEDTKLFRLKLTKEQADILVKETDRVRNEIRDRKQLYTAYVNDTCAETAQDILKTAIVVPDGAGIVRAAHIGTILGYDIWLQPKFTMVNPYMWHKNFKKQYTEISQHINTISHNVLKTVGDPDPLRKYPFEDIK